MIFLVYRIRPSRGGGRLGGYFYDSDLTSVQDVESEGDGDSGQ